MNSNFWQNLKKPFFVLAPMEDVTDTVFRRMVIKFGRPDVFFTEFTSVEGMFSPGSMEVAKRLKYTSEELPLIAQLWGVNPENFRKAASLIADLGFTGIDINMGCPVRKIIKTGGCSALIRTPDLAKEIFLATKEGFKGLPVSVKTRIGFKSIDTENWIGEVLSWNPDALTIHGRTVAELSKVPCHWNEIGRAVKLRDEISPETVVIGNGDVKSVKEGKELATNWGVDGIMIGRGIFENPFVFREDVGVSADLRDRLEMVRGHVLLHREVWGDNHNFNPLKKFFKMYIRGFDGAANIRDEMMRMSTIDEILLYIDSHLKL